MDKKYFSRDCRHGFDRWASDNGISSGKGYSTDSLTKLMQMLQNAAGGTGTLDTQSKEIQDKTDSQNLQDIKDLLYAKYGEKLGVIDKDEKQEIIELASTRHDNRIYGDNGVNLNSPAAGGQIAG